MVRTKKPDLEKYVVDIYEKMTKRDLVIVVFHDETQKKLTKPSEVDIEKYLVNDKVKWILTAVPSKDGLDRLKRKRGKKNLNQMLKDYENVWTYKDGKHRMF